MGDAEHPSATRSVVASPGDAEHPPARNPRIPARRAASSRLLHCVIPTH